MTNNFDLKKFLTENKLTKNAKLISENEDKKVEYKGYIIQPNPYVNGSGPVEYEFYNTNDPDELMGWAGSIEDCMVEIDYLAGEREDANQERDEKRNSYENEGIEEDTEDPNLGKKVDFGTIQLGGVDPSDYPDFSDAYIEYAEYEDGTPLTEDELYDLDSDGSLAQEMAAESLYEGATLDEAINYDNLSKHSIEDLKSLIDVKKKEREKLSSKTNLPPAVKSQEKELGAQISKIERELNSRLKEKEDMNETKLTAREQRLVEMVQDAMAPIGRTDRPVKMFAPKGVEESEMSEEAVEEATVIPEYNTIEELMKSIEDGTNKVAEEYKISEMKKIAEALRAKSKKMEESEHAQHISPKVVKDILTHAKKLEAAAEKLKTALEKKSKKGKSAEPKVEKEEPVLAEGFDLRKYLIENRKK